MEALVITFGLLVVAQWASGVPLRRFGALMIFVITLVVHFVNLWTGITFPPCRWQYCRQWDYAIDAFPDETLAKMFPEGCFLPVPEKYVAPEFKDGDLARRLRIFKMKCDH